MFDPTTASDTSRLPRSSATPCTQVSRSGTRWRDEDVGVSVVIAKRRAWSSMVCTAARLILGGVWIWAGLAKFADPDSAVRRDPRLSDLAGGPGEALRMGSAAR